MTQLGFFVDLSKCTGCKTCQVACKDKNNLEVGRNFRRVSEYAGGTWKEVHGAWQQDVFAYYVSIACNHCAKPGCVEVCPKQAITKRVLTPAQRARYSVEFSLEALLRGNAAQRADLYSKLVQNGIATRAECRQLENLPPMDGTDQLTAQINLAPLHMLGQVQKGSSNATQEVNSVN